MRAPPPPLIVQSTDGSLVGLYQPPPKPVGGAASASSASSSGSSLIRIFDGQVSSGSLKFTLRVPSSSSSSHDDEIRKLIFASSGSSGDSSSSSSFSPRYLCGMKSSSILIWDLDRGVLSHTVHVSSVGTKGSSKKKKKKKKRKSSSIGGGDDGESNGVLCDMAAHDGRLYALLFFDASSSSPSSPSDIESNRGKCRVFQYDLNANEETLTKKIKVGSAVVPPSIRMSPSSMAVAVSPDGHRMAIRANDVLRVCDAFTGEKLGKMDISSMDSGTGYGAAAAGAGDKNEDLDGKPALLRFSRDGTYVATCTNGFSQISLFSIASRTKNDDDDAADDEEKNVELTKMALLSPNESSSPITQLDLSRSKINDSEIVAVVTFQPFAGVASLFKLSTAGSSKSGEGGKGDEGGKVMVPQLPKANLQTKRSKHGEISDIHGFVMAGFHPRHPEDELCLLFRKEGSTTLGMETHSYSSLRGTHIVGTSLLAPPDERGTHPSSNAAGESKKRKGDNVAMPPGDQGREATMALDLTGGDTKKKRKRTKTKDGDATDDADENEVDALDAEGGGDDLGDNFELAEDAGEEEGEKGQSIAERLALLSSAMEQSSDDDDGLYDDEEEGGDEKDGVTSKQSKQVTDANEDAVATAIKFKSKSATTESLTALLTQALSSNDSIPLNIALQVTDRRLVENTVRSLQALDARRYIDRGNERQTAPITTVGYLPMLMGHIVRRMARRHSLVVPLGVWIKAILAATARATFHSTFRNSGGGSTGNDEVEERMARDAREMASKLGPLKNFLNERVECFPELLRLEGRLSLLSQQL